MQLSSTPRPDNHERLPASAAERPSAPDRSPSRQGGAKTRSHDARDDIQADQRFLATLISNLPGYAYRCKPDAAQTLEYVSDGIVSLTGYHADDIVGGPVASRDEIVHPDDRDRVREQIDDALAAELPWSVTYRMRTRSGEERWAHEQGRAVYGRSDRIEALEAYVTDITEQKQAELELLDSERQLRTIIEHAPEAMLIMDLRAGHCVDVNENAVALFGYPREELLQLDFLELSPPHQSDGRDSAAAARALVDEVLAGRSPCVEWMQRDANGRGIPCEVRLVKLPSAGGTLVRASVTDIRERKRLQAQSLQAQKMESVGRLAGGIAHDFNNLMTAAIGYADLALASLPEGDAATADVREIRETAERAASLSHQLLAFSRQEIIEPRVLDLNQLIGKTERILRRLIGDEREFVTSLAAEPCLVRVDPGQFEQVLINLAVNARDATPAGGRITIATAHVDTDDRAAEDSAGGAPGPQILLAVSDNGSGMTDEVRAHLFEPFFTTKPVGAGTGLGLATCYGVVQQAGGMIQVESERGRGSAFTIHLPRPEEPIAPAPAQGDPQQPARGTETLLVVDDEPAVRAVTVRALRASGYAVIEAPNGEEALRVAAATSERIDLLLTDVVMPHMGGADLAAKLRAARPGTAVLFTSGYTEDAVVRREVGAEAIAYLAKPFSPASLSAKVREVLDAAGVRRA